MLIESPSRVEIFRSNILNCAVLHHDVFSGCFLDETKKSVSKISVFFDCLGGDLNRRIPEVGAWYRSFCSIHPRHAQWNVCVDSVK